MRGRFCTQPFLVESHCPAPCRLYVNFLLLRWVPGRPLIRPGCAGPPSPQGEGFGRGTQKSSLKNPPKESFQIRARRWVTKKTCDRFAASPNPKDGASPSERFYSRGCRGEPPAILSPCFLIKKAGPPPGRRGNGALRPEAGPEAGPIGSVPPGEGPRPHPPGPLGLISPGRGKTSNTPSPAPPRGWGGPGPGGGRRSAAGRRRRRRRPPGASGRTGPGS